MTGPTRRTPVGPDRIRQLWAGWRGAYLSGDGPPPPGGSCALCEALDPDGPQGAWIVHRDDTVAVMLNAFPYTNGHLLVLPRRHVDDLAPLSEEESSALWGAVTDSVATVRDAYGPDGVNIGSNLGAAAGAGVPDHLHVHVLPRWFSDTSFTTTTAGLRVLPETLDDSAARLRAAWGAR